MAKEDKSTILIATISAISAVVIAVVTTYGTIAVSAPEAKKVKKELEQISDLEKIANLPIGTITPSMLHPSVFAKTVGDPSVFDPETSKWVLADGQKDITNSQYGKLLGNTRFTPDLRGMFLRGLNEGRKDDKRDPDDERKPGGYQEDALQRHRHDTDALKLDRHIDQDTKELGYTSRGGADAGKASVTTVTGEKVGEKVNVAGETRPKNVAVYFYIKIN